MFLHQSWMRPASLTCFPKRFECVQHLWVCHSGNCKCGKFGAPLLSGQPPAKELYNPKQLRVVSLYPMSSCMSQQHEPPASSSHQWNPHKAPCPVQPSSTSTSRGCGPRPDNRSIAFWRLHLRHTHSLVSGWATFVCLWFQFLAKHHEISKCPTGVYPSAVWIWTFNRLSIQIWNGRPKSVFSKKSGATIFC